MIPSTERAVALPPTHLQALPMKQAFKHRASESPFHRFPVFFTGFAKGFHPPPAIPYSFRFVFFPISFYNEYAVMILMVMISANIKLERGLYAWPIGVFQKPRRSPPQVCLVPTNMHN